MTDAKIWETDDLTQGDIVDEQPNMAVVAYQLQSLHNDVVDMKTVLSNLTKAVTKLALVEERQTRLHEAQERVFTIVDGVEKRLVMIETKLPEHNRAAIWIDRMTWAVMGLFGMYVAKSIGLIG